MLNLLKGPIQFSNHLFTGIDALARHRLMSVLVVFLLSFGGSWLFSTFRGIPVPYMHDEFSYLLAGDTFAHGRMTNPTHPMWEYFETFHVLQHPSYMSKYPPGQGIFLALGQVLFGHPIYGVWLSAGLMCAAICWMLYALLTPRWALVGGLVSALQFGIFTYWSQSYWGGAVAALGGALVFGALPRIIKYQRLRDAIFMGLGIGILANTRPLEGIIFGIPLGCLLLPWKSSDRHYFLFKKVVPVTTFPLDKRRLVTHVLLPLGLLLLAVAVLMGIYNKKITGNAFELPHILYERQYESTPIFTWQSLAPPVHYNHKAMADHAKYWALDNYLYKRTWRGLAQDISDDGMRLCMFFFGYPLALPSLVLMVRLLFRRKTAGRYFMFLCVILFMMGTWDAPLRPHYIASLTCFAVLLITTGLRGLSRLSFRQSQIGPAVIVFLMGLQLLLNIILTPVQPAVKSLAQTIPSSQINLPGSFSREELKNILKGRRGKYLVVVQYPLWHSFYREWVYNDADIDHAPIVWARDMGTTRDAGLLNYFKDRQVLFINVFWDIKGFPSYSARQ